MGGFDFCPQYQYMYFDRATMDAAAEEKQMKAVTKNVYGDVLVLMLLGTVISEQYFFLAGCAYLLCLVFRNRMRIILPHIAGLKLYILVVGYALFAGLFLYNLRAVVRDVYYIFSTLVWILTGALIAFLNQNNMKNFYKTLFLYGGFASMKTMAVFLLHFSISFDALRNIFTENVYDVGFIMPMAFIQIVFFGRVFINKKLDCLILLLMSLHIFLSFGRIAILQPLLFLLSAMIMVIESAKSRAKALRKIAIMVCGLMVVLIAGFYLVPGKVSSVFFQKVMNSFSEVNAQQKITSVESAMQNWRGYEIQAAQQQWLESNPIAQIFGSGMGKGIKIQYIPYSWENMVENNEIPLLHNGFYTMLIKGGLLGAAALMAVLVWPLLKGVELARLHENREVGCILAGTSVAALANTYVSRGPVQQGAFLVWALLVGWLAESLTLEHRRNPPNGGGIPGNGIAWGRRSTGQR